MFNVVMFEVNIVKSPDGTEPALGIFWTIVFIARADKVKRC